jgi:replicative DNA helicase
VPTTAEKLINSVCATKQIAPLMADNVDDLFGPFKDVWVSMRQYYMQYKSIPDITVLTDKFKQLEMVPAEAEPAFYLEELKSEYLYSRMDEIMQKGMGALDKYAPAQVLDKLMQELGNLGRFTNNVRDLDITDYEQAERHLLTVKEKAAVTGSVGIKTNVKAIDAAYPTGMAGGHFIVAIGWPGRGKTWFTAYLAIQAWLQGYKPMIVSLEMSPEDMRSRIYTMMASGLFSATDFARGQINIDNFREWGKKTLTDKSAFTIVSNEGVGDVTPNVVQGKIEQHRPDLVICDYHQLFSDNAKSANPTQRNMMLSKEFKRLAMTNNIPLIDITAATNNDGISGQDNPPMLSQVAWSKQIEYDADMAFAVHRDNDSGLIEVISRKNRHGSDFGFFLEADLDRGIWKESYGV